MRPGKGSRPYTWPKELLLAPKSRHEESETMVKPKIGALAPWKGSNRLLAHEVGKELEGAEWVGIVFAGGMAEVPRIKARTLLVNDVHRHVMNLATVVANESECQRLIAELESLPFHPDILSTAQKRCAVRETVQAADRQLGDRLWALNYFVTCWMSRSAIAGTRHEFKGNLPVRWEPGGGDSNVRYRSAVESLQAWNKTLRRCNFTTLDFREFLRRCYDRPNHGIYCDAPFPDAGNDYRHPFTHADHKNLAAQLAEFTSARVVCRFYDHPLIRELYPEPKWKWRRLKGRKQSNAAAPEVLLLNQPSRAEQASGVGLTPTARGRTTDQFRV